MLRVYPEMMKRSAAPTLGFIPRPTVNVCGTCRSLTGMGRQLRKVDAQTARPAVDCRLAADPALSVNPIYHLISKNYLTEIYNN
jgi:hypothetical protein